ncbi:MAG: ribonuclease P protein component [Bacilli bacterium]
MKKINIIKKNDDFSRIIHNCPYIKNDLYVIYIDKNNNLNNYQFGISVSKKIGKAVVRNKIKRQIKNIIDKFNYQNNFNCIIIVKKNIISKNYAEMREKLLFLLSKEQLIEGEKNEKK